MKDVADNVDASHWWWTNRGMAVLLLLVFGTITAFIWSSDWAHRELRDGFTLGGFPLFALGAIGLSLMVLLFDGQARKVEPEMVSLTLATFLVVGGAVLALVVTFLAMPYIGFVFAAAGFICAGATVLGFRPVWKAALFGLGAAIIIRLILLGLSVAIEDGPLTPLLGT